jgi:hypothetical protein
MMTGEAKKLYQRDYMRKQRIAQKTASLLPRQSNNSVRPDVRPDVRPIQNQVLRPCLDADGNMIPEI